MDENAPEASVGIDALRQWLSRTDRDAVAEVLAGCDLDDGVSIELAPIEGVDAAAATLILGGDRRVSLRRIAGSALIVDRRPGQPLLPAIASTKTPDEYRQAHMAAELPPAGGPGRLRVGSRPRAGSALPDTRGGEATPDGAGSTRVLRGDEAHGAGERQAPAGRRGAGGAHGCFACGAARCRRACQGHSVL